MMNVKEVSSNEFDALCLSLDKVRLRKRLLEAKAVLNDEYRKLFTKASIYKYQEKALYSVPRGYKLQWQTRQQPDQPESYENQQTTIGDVYLVKLRDPLEGRTK